MTTAEQTTHQIREEIRGTDKDRIRELQSALDFEYELREKMLLHVNQLQSWNAILFGAVLCQLVALGVAILGR